MERGILAGNIKRIIADRGLKQMAVAQRLGIPPKTFSAMLTGRQLIPTTQIGPLAKALEVTPNELFAEESDA